MNVLATLIADVLFCVPAALAGLVSARLSRTSRDEWALLAWVPPLPLAALGIYLAVVTTRDPTAANLWPFAMVLVALLTAVLFGVFLAGRWLLGARR